MGTNKTNFLVTTTNTHLESFLFDFCHFCNWTWLFRMVKDGNILPWILKSWGKKINSKSSLFWPHHGDYFFSKGFPIFWFNFKIIMDHRPNFVQSSDQRLNLCIRQISKFFIFSKKKLIFNFFMNFKFFLLQFQMW